MNKVVILRVSGIVFDQCPKCDSLFLDKNELEEASEWYNPDAPKTKTRVIDGRRVRTEQSFNVKARVSTHSGAISPVFVSLYRIIVFYRRPVDFRIHITPNHYFKRMLIALGFFRNADIKTGYDQFDRMLSVLGDDPEKIRHLLASENLRDQLIQFVKNHRKIMASFEITDKSILFTTDSYKIPGLNNISEISDRLVKQMILIAELIE